MSAVESSLHILYYGDKTEFLSANFPIFLGLNFAFCIAERLSRLH